MKYLKAGILSLLLFFTVVSVSYAMELSLNNSGFSPEKTLILTLNEDWSGEADVYIAVTLPGSDKFFYLTPQNTFSLNKVLYAQKIQAKGSKEILRMVLPANLPAGEYTFYAMAMRSSVNTIIDKIIKISFTFDDTRLPDGVIGRTYSFAIQPKLATPPYQFKLSSGTLPNGLTLGLDTGLIQGTPTDRESSNFKIQITDAKGNTAEIERAIKVYSVLSFGKDGTFKGCNGLQMAFNLVKDLDEIRIEEGTYKCNGLIIPAAKTFEHGIKISGGWDSSFQNQNDKPELTVFDGGAERIESAKNEKQCKKAGGIWGDKILVCFKKEPPNSSILSMSATGVVAIEDLSFQNGNTSDYGGAISGNGKVSITNSTFTNNSASSRGGAVYEAGNISNSTFTNNSASSSGGAVYEAGNITNSTFTNNSASSRGGAVYEAGNISNSTFTNNSGGAVSDAGNITNSTFTNNSGGAVCSSRNISNSTFTNNSASSSGGAVCSSRNISNSTFTNNSADVDGGAVYRVRNITNSTFTNNSASRDGGAVFDIFDSGYISNSTFTNNSASKSSGAVYVRSYFDSSTIINSIFTNNSATEKGGAIFGINSKIVNCTIANNTGGGFYGSGTILNTIFAQNKADKKDNDITPDGDLHVDYTLVNNISGVLDLGTHIIMGDPSFVNAANGDFHLGSNSPAINVGDSEVIKSYPFLKNQNEQEIDLEGKSRIVGKAIDLGAYEFQ